MHYHQVVVQAGLPALWSDGAPGAMTLEKGVSVVGADKRRSEPVTLDAEELARAIRGLTVEAHEIMNRPDAATGELIKLRRRSKELGRVARGSQLTEIERWLRSVHRTLDAKLLSALVVELELAVA
jgi:hypothetical protein